jgi:hypothetical protein
VWLSSTVDGSGQKWPGSVRGSTLEPPFDSMSQIWAGVAFVAISGAVCVSGFVWGAGVTAMLVLALVAVIILWAASSGLRPTDGSGLGPLIAASVGIRILGAVVFNATGFNLAVAPDSYGYIYRGEFIAQSWDKPYINLYEVSGYNPRSFYQHLNALAIYVSDVKTAEVSLSIMNGFVVTLACYLMSRIAAELYDERSARMTFILCAFCPSIVLWTSINLRDAWSFLLMAGAILSALRMRQHPTAKNVIWLCLSLAAMPFVRGYLVPLIGIGMIASYSIVRLRQLPAAIASLALLVVVLSILAGRFEVATEVDVGTQLSAMQDYRRGLAYGGSAVNTSIDISTPKGALLYLPYGLAVFLFAPFPWSLRSWRQLMSYPEVLAWYFVFFYSVKVILADIRARRAEIALPLFVLGTMCIAYALVEGNEGTAYRHRAHALLLFFVFAGRGLSKRFPGVPKALHFSSRIRGGKRLPDPSPLRSTT